MKKSRVDKELVAQGFFIDLPTAQRAIMAGIVSTDSRRIEKPGEMIAPGIYLHVKGQNRFVSRGGLKLEGALEAFHFSLKGFVCLDIGCSTGGFTDCLLRYGAQRVVAVDVGYAQFDWSLRNDKRVVLRERCNVVDITDLDAVFDLAVCDVSFTSIGHIIQAPYRMLKDGGYFLTLIKPQFEALKSQVGPKGIIEDPQVRLLCVKRALEAMEQQGFVIQGLCGSPICGTKGNKEYLTLAQKASSQDFISEDIVHDLIFKEHDFLR